MSELVPKLIIIQYNECENYDFEIIPRITPEISQGPMKRPVPPCPYLLSRVSSIRDDVRKADVEETQRHCLADVGELIDLWDCTTRFVTVVFTFQVIIGRLDFIGGVDDEPRWKRTLWRQDMETHSAWLALCVGNPAVISAPVMDSLHKGAVNQMTNLGERQGESIFPAQDVASMSSRRKIPSQWRHNDKDGVSNYRRLDCVLSRLFRRRSRKTSKLCATGLCEWNPPMAGGFPSQVASNAENVSIWWRHHAHFHARRHTWKAQRFYHYYQTWRMHIQIYSCIRTYVYSISQDICTRFCCALLCCGYVIVRNEFKWSIYPYSSGLLCWHWGNR